MGSEKFDLLIHFNSERNKWNGQEFMGIVELEQLFQDMEGRFFIKESEFPNTVMVEVEKNPLEAYRLLLKSPTKVVSRAMYIESTVETCGNQITEQPLILSDQKPVQGINLWYAAT
jgi:tRNA acetyltransferase TAN1